MLSSKQKQMNKIMWITKMFSKKPGEMKYWGKLIKLKAKVK